MEQAHLPYNSIVSVDSGVVDPSPLILYAVIGQKQFEVIVHEVKSYKNEEV